MQIPCIGGGPAGLCFALLVEMPNPACELTEVERSRAFDTRGSCVVLSDRSLTNLQAAYVISTRLVGQAFNFWDDLQMFFKTSQCARAIIIFAASGAKKLLNILLNRCQQLAVNQVSKTDVGNQQAMAAHCSADLVIWSVAEPHQPA